MISQVRPCILSSTTTLMYELVKTQCTCVTLIHYSIYTNHIRTTVQLHEYYVLDYAFQRSKVIRPKRMYFIANKIGKHVAESIHPSAKINMDHVIICVHVRYRHFSTSTCCDLHVWSYQCSACLAECSLSHAYDLNRNRHSMCMLQMHRSTSM